MLKNYNKKKKHKLFVALQIDGAKNYVENLQESTHTLAHAFNMIFLPKRVNIKNIALVSLSSINEEEMIFHYLTLWLC